MTSPEPWASYTDYIMDSTDIERAIHANNRYDTVNYLYGAAKNLDHAAGYWTTYGDTFRANEATNAANTFRAWGKALDEGQFPGLINPGPDERQNLERWQKQVLYMRGQAINATLAYDVQTSGQIWWLIVGVAVAYVYTKLQ